MKEFYSSLDASRKNYLIISPEHAGRVHIAHDSKTDDEIGEITDFYDCAAVTSLAVGESCTIADGSAIVVRIS